MKMADSESTSPVTIIWKDYYKALQTGIWSLFKDQLLVDVSLTCHQQGLKVHRLILAVFFPGLKESLLQAIKPLEENSSNEEVSQQVQIDLNLGLPSTTTTKEEDILKFLMEFAYSGRATVPRESLDNMLAAAEQLGFEGLVNSIREQNVSATSYEEADDQVKNTVGLCENDHEYYKQNDSEDCESVSPSSGTLRLKGSKLRTNRKGVPIKLRKSIGRQCKATSDKDAAEVKSEEETVSDRSYDPQTEKKQTKRKGRKRNTRDDSNSDNETSEEVEEDAESEAREQDENNGVKDELSSQNEEWKPRPTITKLSNRNKCGRKPKRKRSRAMLSCDYCHYTTSDKLTYSNHLAKHDPSVEVQIFTCEFCSKAFKSKKGYRCHMKTHENPELQFKCDHCSFSTPQKWTWRQHLAVMHKVDESGNPLADNITCDQCEFTCVALHQLKAHLLRKHTLDKPFKCLQCDYSTITRSELETHVGVQHRKERHYMCETCGFRSQTQSGLKRHYRSHLGIKPFKCELCGMEYADRGKYKSHLQRHTSDEKPFICHICGHACRRRDNLQMHLRRIHRVGLDNDNVIGSGSCVVITDSNVIPTEGIVGND